MNKTVFFLHFLFVILFFLDAEKINSQNYSAQQCLKMWKDKKTYHQQDIITDLVDNYDSVKVLANLQVFDDYIHSHPKDVAIKANVLLYRIYTIMEMPHFAAKFQDTSQEIKNQIEDVSLLNDKNLLGWLYFIYGGINVKMGNMEVALLYNLKALDVFDRLPDNAFPNRTNIYLSIVRSLYFTFDYEKAIEYALKCQKAIEKEKLLASEIQIYTADYLFNCALKLNNMDMSEKYLDELKKALDEYSFEPVWQNEIWQAVYFYYLGRINFEKGNYSEAKQHFLLAYPVAEKYNDESNVISLKTWLGSVYYKEDRKEEAEREWLSAYALCTEFMAKNKQEVIQTIGILSALIDFYKKEGDYKNAFKYAEEYQRNKDIVNSEIAKSNFRISQATIDIGALNENLYLANKEIKVREVRTLFIIMSAIVLILFLLIILTSRIRKNKLILQIKEQEKRKVDMELLNAQKYIDVFKKSIIEKNTIISDLTNSISWDNKKNATKPFKNTTILTEEDWNVFQDEFTKIYPLFFSSLKNRFPTITPALLRLSALILLELDNDEIATSLGIGKKSVQRSILRLRKALGLDSDEDIAIWLKSFYDRHINIHSENSVNK